MPILFRFYGVRRLSALTASFTLSNLILALFSSTPPAHFEQWPERATTALTSLISGSLAFAFCVWVYLLLKPLLFRPDWLGRATQIVLGLILLMNITAPFKCLVGGFYLVTVESGGFWPVIKEFLRTVGWPLAIGTAPLWLLELYEFSRAQPFLRRLFGRGYTAGWASPYVDCPSCEAPTLKTLSKAVSSTRDLSAAKFWRRTAMSNSQMIVDESPAHWCYIGRPGSGKTICNVASLSRYLGSIIHVSKQSLPSKPLKNGFLDEGFVGGKVLEEGE